MLDPTLNAVAQIREQTGLLARIYNECREVTMNGVEIGNGAFVCLSKTVFSGQKKATLFLFHLNDRTLQLRQEIQHLVD